VKKKKFLNVIISGRYNYQCDLKVRELRFSRGTKSSYEDLEQGGAKAVTAQSTIPVVMPMHRTRARSVDMTPSRGTGQTDLSTEEPPSG
jgi:hypothetical protein